jgi:hypothetical protein
MSKPNPVRKNVATPASNPAIERASRKENVVSEPLIFGKTNYLWMGIGAALVFLGLILMLGGQQPSAEVWDENIIYSSRIISVAPIVILAGLIVEIYAIFKD